MWIMMQHMWPHPKLWFSSMETPTKHAPTLCQAGERCDGWNVSVADSSLLHFQKQSRQNQSKIIESYVFGLLLCGLTPEWTPSMTQSILTVSFCLSDPQILQMFSLVACFVFCFLPSCWLESSRISHVFTQPATRKKQLVDLGLQEVAAIWKTPREDKKTK